MKIIITGAGGQLGKSLISLAPKDIDLYPFTRKEFDLTNFENVKKLLPKLIQIG